MTTFIVNGQEKELTMYFNGIECSADFIGNAAHGMDNDEDGNYIATQEDFEWWENTILAHENMENVIAAYKEKFDTGEVDQVVQDWINDDLESQPSQVLMGLEQAFGELS